MISSCRPPALRPLGILRETLCRCRYTVLTVLALLVVCDVDSIVITRSILCSVNDSPIVKPGVSLYRRSLYRGSAQYILL